MPTDRCGRRRRIATSALVGLAGILMGAHAAVAATPSVVGTVAGKLPSRSQAATEIRAIELGGARLAAAATVSATGAFRLALPPGAYLLDMSVTPRHGRGSAAVHTAVPVSIAPGQRRRGLRIAKPKAKARRAAAGAPYAQAAYSQESGRITPGRIAFSIENFTGATGDLSVFNRGLTALLETDLSSTPCRTAEVANSADRVFVEQELRLQRSRYFDPATRVRRNFVIPDIVVRGRLQTRGANLGYALTLTDSRTGKVLETLSGTLAGSDVFAAEQRLATRLARRICAYGEVFEATFTGTGIATFATHSATGTLSAQPIEAKPTAKDSGGAIRWEGTAPASWTAVTTTSTTDCSYRDPISDGTWTAELERAGEALRVHWHGDKGTTGTATAVCPTSDGGEVIIRGQPTTSLVGSTPDPFILPADGRQDVTGGLKSQGHGWDNTLELKVRTIRVEPLS